MIIAFVYEAVYIPSCHFQRNVLDIILPPLKCQGRNYRQKIEIKHGRGLGLYLLPEISRVLPLLQSGLQTTTLLKTQCRCFIFS